MAGLSKSRIMSSLQCLKRVHLEIHRKDLLEYSKATEAAFAIGHEVGDMAIRICSVPGPSRLSCRQLPRRWIVNCWKVSTLEPKHRPLTWKQF